MNKTQGLRCDEGSCETALKKVFSVLRSNSHPVKNAAQKKAQLGKAPFELHLRYKKEMLIQKECKVTRGQNEKILSMPT